jgi:DnaK suppressor protein
MSSKKNEAIKFPMNLIMPIKDFLENEMVKMKITKKKIHQADPFSDENRTLNNSVEEDLDEQLGHFDAQIKSKFIDRQIVQIRKALSRIKVGKYGICEECGEMIDTERLAIKPETTVCVKCKNESEK